MVKKMALGLWLILLGKAAIADSRGSTTVYNHTQIQTDGSTVYREMFMNILDVTEDGESFTVELINQVIGEVDDEPVVRTMPLGRGETEGYVTIEVAEELMEACVARGGSIETVTVPAGTFETCHTYEKSEKNDSTFEIWGAVVPGGYVKQKIFWAPSGKTNIFELREILPAANEVADDKPTTMPIK